MKGYCCWGGVQPDCMVRGAEPLVSNNNNQSIQKWKTKVNELRKQPGANFSFSIILMNHLSHCRRNWKGKQLILFRSRRPCLLTVGFTPICVTRLCVDYGVGSLSPADCWLSLLRRPFIHLTRCSSWFDLRSAQCLLHDWETQMKVHSCVLQQVYKL